MKRDFQAFKNRTAVTKEDALGNAKFALLKPKESAPGSAKIAPQ